MTSYHDYLDKRLTDLEYVSASQWLRMSDLEDKLRECRDRIRALVSKDRVTVSAFYKNHPGVLADMDRIDAVLGTAPDRTKRHD